MNYSVNSFYIKFTSFLNKNKININNCNIELVTYMNGDIVERREYNKIEDVEKPFLEKNIGNDSYSAIFLNGKRTKFYQMKSYFAVRNSDIYKKYVSLFV